MASSYLKAMQLRRILEERAKETEKVRKPAEKVLNEVGKYDVSTNLSASRYYKKAEELMGEKRYEDARFYASLAGIAVEKPEKADKLFFAKEKVKGLTEITQTSKNKVLEFIVKKTENYYDYICKKRSPEYILNIEEQIGITETENEAEKLRKLLHVIDEIC
ncbi:MAG: hypothetical protein PHU12_01045 [Candidatus Aenigmarchaeota archaeon]|nr:hypothetical protein [Candidatus Aenigmarchaeota archaeon]